MTTPMDVDDVINLTTTNLEMDDVPSTTNPTSKSTEISHNPTTHIRSIPARATTSPSVTGTAAAPLITNTKPTLTLPAGQMVLIQKPGSALQQIRICSGSANGSSVSPIAPTAATSGTPTNIKFIQTIEGKRINLKKNGNQKATPAALPQLRTIGMTSSATSATISNGGAGGANTSKRIMIANQSDRKLTPVAQSIKIPKATGSNSSSPAIIATPTMSTLPSSSSSINPSVTLTVAQAQKIGLISSAKLKELVSQATAQKQAKSFAGATSSPARAVSPIPTRTSVEDAQIPTIVAPKLTYSTSTTPVSTSHQISPIGAAVPSSSKPHSNSTLPSPITATNHKILIQTADGIQKQVVLPPHLYRLAQQGQIKSVSFAGKGVHYVRIASLPLSDENERLEPNATTEASEPEALSKVKATGALPFPLSPTNISRDTSSSVNPTHRMFGGTGSSSATTSAKTPITSYVVHGTPPLDETMQGADTGNKFLRVGETKQSGQESQNDHEAGNRFVLITPPVISSTYLEAEGPRRKHCNCTKSQCLKLYCDCFANGEFCQNCNCKDCFNNLAYEEERKQAINMCLERNPHAFKPKIGKGTDTSDALRRHNKGCNCKRSGCLKNYCECYGAKIVCSENCKCIDCHNVEGFDAIPRKGNLNDSRNHHQEHELALNQSRTSGMEFEKSSSSSFGGKRADRGESPEIPPKIPCNFMTQDVIEATIQCVVAQADECQKKNMDSKTSEMLLLEEFGRCLLEIIDFSMKNNDTYAGAQP